MVIWPFQKKTLFAVLLFIMFAKWESITHADILTIFGVILSRPVAFLGSNSFIILFISSLAAAGMSKFSFLVQSCLLFQYFGDFCNV